MDLSKYQSNSQVRKSPRDCLSDNKPEPRTETKIIKGGVRTKQPSIGSRLARELKGDDTRSVGNYLMDTVIIPRGKEIVGDILSSSMKVIQDTIEVAIFGEVKSTKHRKTNWRSNYKDYYDKDRNNYSKSKHQSKGYEEQFFETREDARDVLDCLLDRIDTYGCVSVADYYEMIGLTSTYQDRKYGWDRLGTAEIIKAGREYLLDLPRPKVLD